MTRVKPASGASLLEMVLAALVLAVGLIPVVTTIQGTSREARQLEAHVQALARCRGLIEAARAYGPRTFDLYISKSAEATLPIKLPLEAPKSATPGAGDASAVLSRIANLKEKVTVKVARQAGGASLYLLRATVAWDALGDERRPTTVELVTLVTDPLGTWRQEGGPR